MLTGGWTYTTVTLVVGEPSSGSWWHTREWFSYERLVAGRPGYGVWLNGTQGEPANDVKGRPVYRGLPVRAQGPSEDGWRDDGWPTQVLDLAHTSPADRWRAVRRSYKSLIHRAQRTTRLLVWDHTLPADAAVEACRRLHVEAAGRETRPRATWQLMADWIHEGHGMLVLALKGGPQDVPASYEAARAADGSIPSPSTILDQPANQPAISADMMLGWAYVYTYQGWAYYGHAVNRRPDIGPAIQWTAIEALAARGDITHYELGWQQPTEDPKEQAIQFFKRGFGGELWWQPILTPNVSMQKRPTVCVKNQAASNSPDNRRTE